MLWKISKKKKQMKRFSGEKEMAIEKEIKRVATTWNVWQ